MYGDDDDDDHTSLGISISENTLAAVLISVFPFRSSFDSAVVCCDIKGGLAVCVAGGMGVHLQPPLQSILSLHGYTAGGGCAQWCHWYIWEGGYDQ